MYKRQDIGSSASFSFNLSSSVKIAHIDIGVIHGNYGVVSVPADKIISSGTVTCSVDIGYSGSWGIDYICPVSYTHLDVYKRQSIRSLTSTPSRAF